MRSSKRDDIQVCPKCGKPYRPDKTVSSVFGLANYGFRCKYCRYQGAGPIKISRSDYPEFLKSLGKGQ